MKNIGCATNPHETCADMERTDDWHTAAAHDFADKSGAKVFSHLADENDCKYTIEFHVLHGRNAQETYGNLIRRLEQLAGFGRGET